MDRITLAQEKQQELGISESNLAGAFPEFDSVKERLLYGEIRQTTMPAKQACLVTIATLATTEGDDLSEQLKAARKANVEPEALQELFHQIALYIDFPRSLHAIATINDVLKKR